MPASPLVVTPGAANANAYVTVAVADQYHADRPDPDGTSTWTSTGADAKIQAILWATKLLDSLFVWTGYVATVGQPLLWPRWGMFYRDEWTLVPNNIIPVQLQWATAEFARQLVVADRAGDSDLENQRISSVRAGSVAITLNVGVTAKPLPDAVFYLIPPSWGYPHSRAGAARELQRA